MRHINWFLFTTATIQVGAVAYEFARGNWRFGVIYTCYTISGFLLATNPPK